MTAKSSPLSLSRRRLLGGAAALAGASMLSPRLGSAQTPVGGTPAADVTPGGMLRATLGAEPDTLDPHKGNTLFDRDVWDQLYDALIDDDILSGVRGALAESWDSSDATTWTFKLRQGLTFHDGSPVTSAEVKWSVERVQNPDTGASGALGRIVNHIKTIDTPDGMTIVFTLDAPNAAFPIQMADIKILPQNFDETKPVGAGPFTFGEWVRNQHVLVNKFADYYRQGQPYLDAIEFRPTPDEDQKIVLLQTNQVDFTDTIPLPRAQEVQQGGQLQVFTIPEGVSPSSYFMPVNCRKPPLDNPKVRQAMNFAIDRQAILDATFDFGTIKSSVVPPKHWAFNPNALSFNDRDVDKAKQLLSDAGLSGGFDIELKHITSRAEYATIAQIVQANLADVGINVKILPEEIGVWVDEVLNKHDFQWGMTGIIPAYDPDYMMSRYDINDADGASMGWENDEYQQLLVQGRGAVEQEDRKKIYFRAQEIVQEAAPGFIINERPILYGASMAVQGFRPDMRQHTHFTSVWLKK